MSGLNFARAICLLKSSGVDATSNSGKNPVSDAYEMVLEIVSHSLGFILSGKGIDIVKTIPEAARVSLYCLVTSVNESLGKSVSAMLSCFLTVRVSTKVHVESGSLFKVKTPFLPFFS